MTLLPSQSSSFKCVTLFFFSCRAPLQRRPTIPFALCFGAPLVSVCCRRFYIVGSFYFRAGHSLSLRFLNGATKTKLNSCLTQHITIRLYFACRRRARANTGDVHRHPTSSSNARNGFRFRLRAPRDTSTGRGPVTLGVISDA